ncbi:hypothetical protein RclHR1_00080015 [Rhizophagus clarus]|nr:hypothetical protein RclHR1_00080015 [Rhizophagus clarus]
MRTAYTYNYLPNGKIPPVPHEINTPAVAPNINGPILPHQTNYLGNLSGNNPRNFSGAGDNPSHAMNSYHGQESSVMHNHHFSSQQQQQRQAYEVFRFPGYKVELVFTSTIIQQFARSMNTFFRMDNPSHATDNYQDRESSTMHNYHIPPQQQQQIRAYEILRFPGCKVELVFTPTINQQFTQSMNTLQFGLDEIPGGNPQSFSMLDNNYDQQPSVIIDMPNYNPSQQQQQPVFFGYETPGDNPQNDCTSMNNYYHTL